MKKCKHNYKPIEFIRCIHNKDMRTLYVYQMQCMERSIDLDFTLYLCLLRKCKR